MGENGLWEDFSWYRGRALLTKLIKVQNINEGVGLIETMLESCWPIRIIDLEVTCIISISLHSEGANELTCILV